MKANELQLPNPVYEEQDKEAEAFETIRQILDLISQYNSLIICFDELDAFEVNDAGLTRAQVVASLTKDLFDNISSGVILSVMMPDTWKDKIKNFSEAAGIPARVSAAYPEPISLNYMDGDSIVSLVTLWLKEFYQEKNLVPPTSTYPFDGDKLKELGKQKPTVRRILRWCADNFSPIKIEDVFNGGNKESDSKEVKEQEDVSQVELAYRKEMAEELGDYMEDVALLEDSLFFGFSCLIGLTVEGVEIKDVTDVEPKRDNNGYINLKVVGKENGKAVKIGVSILQGSHGQGVTAGLKRLIQYKKFSLTRGCLVRSKKINSRWAAQGYLNQLLSKQLGGEWIVPKPEEVKSLIAILSVYEARNDYILSKEQIFDFVDKTGLAANNSLLREILSDPSGQIPTNTVEE